MNPFIKVTWQDVPENFTAEKIRRVKTYFEQKYNSKNVKIVTKTLTNVQNTRLESLEVTDNILDNQYQKILMKDFIKDNAIDVKWELVERLDNRVNGEIDKLNQNLLTGNPSIVGLTNGITTDGVQQEVPLYSLFNYGRPVTSTDVLPLLPTDTPSTLFPYAGYANFNDMRIAAYYYFNLANSTSPRGVLTPLSELYVGQYVWIADYQGTWQVMTPASLGAIIFAKNNLNDTATITFNNPH